LAVALVSEFTALCTNPKASLVAGLGWVVGVTALETPSDAARGRAPPSALNPAEPRPIWKNPKHGAKWIVQYQSPPACPHRQRLL